MFTGSYAETPKENESSLPPILLLPSIHLPVASNINRGVARYHVPTLICSNAAWVALRGRNTF